MYGGSTNTGAKGSKDQFTLERRRTERKHISEDSMFSGPRSDRAFKEGKNHRMHCKGNGDQLVRCSPNTRVSTPMSNRGLKCYSPSGRRPAPFGMDTHVHVKSPGGKRPPPNAVRETCCAKAKSCQELEKYDIEQTFTIKSIRILKDHLPIFMEKIY